MSTQIQFLRTDQVQLRPDPNVLANGMPLLNFNEQEPGLFFKARDGSLIKIGPTAVGELAPNSGANGYAGNTLGEMWLDTSSAVSELKVFDGNAWVIPGAGDTRVSSVGLSVPSTLFEVENSPITSAGTLEVNLIPQVRNRFLAGPVEGSAQVPTFRGLADEDIPGLDGSKITSGLLNQARIPSLDATKITTGVFNSARIPGIDATKIISGVLPYQFGGTGVSSFPQNGELLIGGLSNGWRKTTLQAGTGIGIINGPGTIQLKVAPPGSGGELLFNNGGVLGADNNLTYDGSSNILNLIGELSVSGSLALEYSGGSPTGIEFKGSTGAGVTVQAPGVVSSAYSLTLPTSVPSSQVDNVMVSDNSGNLTLTDSPSLNFVSVRDQLLIQDSFSGNDIAISAPSLAGSLSLTLPSTYGAGGIAIIGSTGEMSVTATPIVTSLVAATSVTAETVVQEANSPGRSFVTGVASLAVSSDGTYNLLEIPADGSAASVNFTVFVHDESAAVGTGTLTASYNAHYNGSTAVLSSPVGTADSFTGTEPAFAVDYSGTNFRIRTTTASGSNELRFMVNYTYVINVDPA
jgi:hypothetical protein